MNLGSVAAHNAVAYRPVHPKIAQTQEQFMAFSLDSKVGEILDDPRARAVLEKHVPMLKSVGESMLSMARTMTLKQVAGFPQAGLSPDKLKAIVDELAKVG